MSFHGELSNGFKGDGPINQNDILGDLYIFNARSLGLTDDYLVDAVIGFDPRHATTKNVGTAKYDNVTERVIFKQSDHIQPLDLTQVVEL